MDTEEVRKEVERIIRLSEIKAVARALRSGNSPRIGQSFDYMIEPPPDASGQVATPREDHGRPYRLVVEQWHLDAAQRLLDES